MKTVLASRVCALQLALVGAALAQPGPGWEPINDAAELKAIEGTSKDVYLAADIDLTNENFEPIETFSGRLDGTGYEIIGFTYEEDDTISCSSCPGLPSAPPMPTGLFREISGATLTNLTLQGFAVAAPEMGTVGGLVGWAHSGSIISNCTITSYGVTDSMIEGRCEVGGMVGRLEGSDMTDCVSDAEVTSSGTCGKWFGGLIGHIHLECEVTYSSATGAVNAWEQVGGLAGNLHGSMMSYCSASGAVTGNANVGGLVAYIQFRTQLVGSSMDHCEASGAVTDSGTGFGTTLGLIVPASGGLVGYAEGDLDPENGSVVVTIEHCEATGVVTTTEDSQHVAGGLLGFMEPRTYLRYSSASGHVDGGHTAGGLVGWCQGVIEDSGADGEVDGEWQTGGLVGALQCHFGFEPEEVRPGGAVARCWYENDAGGVDVVGVTPVANGHATNGHELAAVGGLVGYVFPGAEVFQCWSDTAVTGSGEFVGGSIGLLWGGLVTETVSLGTVDGNDGRVGGLVGGISTSSSSPGGVVDSCVEHSYSWSAVHTSAGGSNAGVGGLIGAIGPGSSPNTSSAAVVDFTYSIGEITGGSTLGGLIGDKVGTAISITNSYWDEETSGLSVSDGGVGFDTENMQKPANFTAWSSAIWDIVTDEYPKLVWQP